MPRIVLPDDSWERLAAAVRADAPVFLPGAFETAPFSEVDALRAAASAADAWRKGAPRRVELYSGTDPLTDPDERLPRSAETRLEAYVARAAAAPGEDVMLIAQGVDAYDPPVSDAALEFMRDLAPRVGLVTGRVDVDVFLGTYCRLPFGIHRHDSGNFMFVTTGTRCLRLWPPQAFERRIRPEDYAADPERYDATALSFEVSAGDLLYWPPNWWHTSVPRGLSASLNINVWVPSSPLTMVLEGVLPGWQRIVSRLSRSEARLVAAESPPAIRADGSVAQLPDSWERGLQDLVALAARAGPVRLDLAAAYLRRCTAFGMTRPPQAARPLLDSDRVQRAKAPIVWIAVDDDTAWSVAGVTATGNGLLWRDVLVRLNRGEPVVIGELLGGLPAASSTGEMTREDGRAALLHLARYGALVRL